jgi:CRP-like cAMP-binding protein
MQRDEVIDMLAGLTLFGDLGRPQLTAVAHIMSEESFPAGQRILRQGFAGSGFYVLLDGEVAVRIDGRDVARLGKGDFFGEISLLLDEPPVADVVALTPIHVLHLGGSTTLREFLLAYPAVMFRMLQSLGRRLARTNVQLQVGRS